MKYRHKELKAAREKRLMTQTELGVRCGLTHATVSMVERGKAPWKKAIREMALVLGVKNVVVSERRNHTK